MKLRAHCLVGLAGGSGGPGDTKSWSLPVPPKKRSGGPAKTAHGAFVADQNSPKQSWAKEKNPVSGSFFCLVTTVRRWKGGKGVDGGVPPEGGQFFFFFWGGFAKSINLSNMAIEGIAALRLCNLFID